MRMCAEPSARRATQHAPALMGRSGVGGGGRAEGSIEWSGAMRRAGGPWDSPGRTSQGPRDQWNAASHVAGLAAERKWT